MNLTKIKAVYKKEIRELVRDKKTMFLLFALPLLIYPLLIMGISYILIMVQSGYESNIYRIAMEGEITDSRVRSYLEMELEEDEEDYGFVLIDATDCKAALEAGEIDAYLVEEGSTWSVYYNSASNNSSYAARYAAERLNRYKDDLSLERFAEAQLDAEIFMNPITVKREDLASNEESMGQILGMIVPLLLIIGVLMGTMTPAVDVTAGEKERGTQETLMTFPMSGRELICGKYLAVATMGALSAILYLVSVGILAAYINGLSGSLGDEATVNLSVGAFAPGLIVVIISTIAFSLFLGAAIMCICSFAKSTKEASSYISPIMVVIMLISYAGYLDVHLTTALSVVPVLNIVLLIKSVMQFEYDSLAILIVLVSNIAYAAFAIAILGKIYTSERILFGEHDGSLFERRSTRQQGAVPTIGDSILVLAITAVLFLYLGTLLQVKFLLAGLGMTQLILLAVPGVASWYGRVDVKKTFSLVKPKGISVMGAVLMAVGAYLLGNMLCSPLAAVAQKSTQVYVQSMELLMTDQNFFITLLVIAVAPAICEEALFRGYLLSAVSKKGKPWVAVFITALVFGLYHMNLFQSSYAFLLGLVLGYVVYRTGSIFCGCLIHFLCNATSVLLTFFPEQMGKVLPFMVADELTGGMIAAALLVGALFMVLGVLLVKRGTAEK